MDDEATYEGIDWGDATHAVLAPRGSLQEKLNQAADAMADTYDALMWCGDDHIFKTEHWDTLMLGALEDMGGRGWVYPETVRRRDVPEIWMCSSGLVKELGWFFPPATHMYYGDNTVGELGKRAGLLRWCPEAVVEHLHYSVRPETAHDEVYAEAEATYGQTDLGAFQQYRADRMPHDVAFLRRKFNADVRWVLGRVA